MNHTHVKCNNATVLKSYSSYHFNRHQNRDIVRQTCDIKYKNMIQMIDDTNKCIEYVGYRLRALQDGKR